MNDIKIFNVRKYIIQLIVPDSSRDLKYSLGDNINVYDENRQFLWNISELLKSYSNDNGLKYYHEMYFEIRLVDNKKIFCIGFLNDCEIDLKSSSITKIVNNR